MSNPIDHPKHYNTHPSGIECIDVVEHLPFNIGNAIKYLWRAGLKIDGAKVNKVKSVKGYLELEKESRLMDLRKAEWYVRREIERQSKKADK